MIGSKGVEAFIRKIQDSAKNLGNRITLNAKSLPDLYTGEHVFGV